jgi:hypothetical protein
MARIVWRQFAVALLAIVAFGVLLRLQAHMGSTRWADMHGGLWSLILLDLPRWIQNALPLAAGVAMALLPLKAGGFPVAVRVSAIVLVALVLYDIAVAPSVNRAYRAAYAPPAGDQVPPLRLDDTAGVLQRAVAHARGIVRPEDLTKWPPTVDSQSSSAPARGLIPITDGAKIVRRDLVSVVGGLGEFLDTLLLTGLVLGFGAWLQRIASFRQERDERLLRLVVAWGTVIGVPLFLGVLFQGAMFDVAMRSGWMGWLLLPRLLVAVPAFLGWQALWRLDRLAGE